MNIIKIYLKGSGSIAELEKDFRLYVGSYQDKLIDIYVPKSIIYQSQDLNKFLTAVKIGAVLTNEMGKKVTTKSFNATYIKDETINGVAYEVYERILPKEFCVFAGTQSLVTNIVNVDNVDNKVLSIITTQIASLPVLESDYLGEEEVITPTDLEIITGQINDIYKQLGLIDVDFESLQQQVNKNTSDIATINETLVTHAGEISKNANDISVLQQQAITQETYIGQIKQELPQGQTHLPDSQLNQFVEDIKQRPPKNGDVIIFIQEIYNATDKTFKYTFGSNGWDYYEIPPTEVAQNDTFGIVSGSYKSGNDDATQVDIVGGIIKNIYVRDEKKIIHRNIKEFINSNMFQSSKNASDINSIITGYQIVGNALRLGGKAESTLSVWKAQSAKEDGNFENIARTYARAENVYTKAESDEMFLPSTYTNVYYYSQDGIVDNVPTTPPDEKQFEVTSTQIGSTTMFDLQKVVEANYNFNKNSTDKSTFWLKADRDCVLEFRLTTSAIKGDITTLLNVELTGELVFKANTLKQVNINSIYNGLGEDEYKLLKGDKLVKKLEVITTESTSTTIALFSGITNASTFNLVAQSISFNVNTINGKKKINILANEWTDNGDGTYSVEITPLRHEQAPSNEYGLDLQIRDSANSIQRVAFTPKITDNGVITITSYEAIDCELLIWSAVQEQQRGILALDNPDALPNIDYLQVGTLRITQTTTSSELTLPIPKNVATATVIHISNASASTQAISVNGVTIEVDNVVAFKWDGVEFQVYNTPDNTSEIFDDFNNQDLNATLQQTKEQLTSNSDEINLITSDISDLNTAVALKLNSKSVELKEGLAVDNLVDFYKYFFNLRKGVDRVWEFEVGKGKNENIMSIFGYPYGEQSSNSAELIVIREATSGIGYTLKIIYTSEKSSTTHIGYIKGWLISGTTYDKYIHFTGWNNASGKKWVDDISQQMTISGTQESVYGIGDILKRPKSNQMIVKVTKGNHSYNGNLLFDTDSQNSAESTIKVDNEDIYFSIDYDTKQFRISKNTSGDTTITLHLFEQR